MRNNKRNNKNRKGRMNKSTHRPMDQNNQVRVYNHYDDPIERPTRAMNKMLAVHTGTQGVPTNGSVVPVLFPIQGIASNERLADAIFLKEIQMNYFVQYTGSVDVIRVIVFQTTGLNPTGIPPAPADILEIVALDSPYILGGETSFRFLHDKCHRVDNSTNQICDVKTRLKPAISNIRFVAGTIQAYSGQVWVCYLNASNGNNGSVNFVTSLFFTD
jgi:hypothetical protein